MSILENQPHQTKPNSNKPHIKQTHPYETELNYTKLNSSIPNQTKPDNSQPNLTNPNWLSMHSRTISSFSLLLALVFALVILENCDLVTHLVTFVFQGLAERSSASQKAYQAYQISCLRRKNVDGGGCCCIVFKSKACPSLGLSLSVHFS